VKARSFVGSAAICGVLLAGMSKQGHSVAAGGGDPLSVAAVPVSGSGSQRQWARQFLAVIGEPQTPCNVAAVTAWQQAEGGGPGGDGAVYNNLNTTQPEPGAWSINSVGVKAYPDYQEGLRANATAITNGLYGGVLAALRAGDNAQAVADAVASSPWGTGSFSAAC
jgi:hypothetical protein